MPSLENQRSGRVEFNEPASLTDGEVWRRQLAEEISDIAQQLNARKQEKAAAFVERHPNGIAGPWEFTPEERAENVAYMDWRKKALGALRAREKALRQLNDWLKAERRKQHLTEHSPAGEQDVSRLIGDAYQLFVKLRSDDVEFDSEEWDVIERLRRYIDHRPRRETDAA